MKKEIRMNISGAIRRTLTENMERDPSIFLIGEDIADPYGGIHNVTKGIQQKVDPQRVINSPLSEIAIAGAGVGAAIAGMHPVVEIMYADFLPICMDQIVNQAAKAHFLSGGKLNVPMVIRANYGTGKGEGAQHSQDPTAWLLNFPGVKIVAPATPRDAQGLMLAALQDKNPVLFCEHKMLYTLPGAIMEENEPIEIGRASVEREGSHVTIVAAALMFHYAMKAAAELAKEGIECEVINPRTIKPFDYEAVIESIGKTGRLLVVEESPYTGGWGAQVVSTIAERAFDRLRKAPVRLAAQDAPLAADPAMEAIEVPSAERIAEAARALYA